MIMSEQEITARYAIGAYSFILPYYTWFTGEQFAASIESMYADSPRTRAVIESVKAMVIKIYHTHTGDKYVLKNVER